MSGYRDRSNYDPYASPSHGRPMRPFNWVQWTGVALILVGVAAELYYMAGQLGWVRKLTESPMLGSTLVLLSLPLINSRREGVTDLAPELASARKRWMIIVIAVCAVILGAATIIDIARS